MFDCLSRRLGSTWNGFLRTFLPVLLAALGIVAIQALLTGNWAAAQVLALEIIGFAAVVLLSMIIADVIICAAQQTGSSPSGNPAGGSSPPTGDVDCATAKAALADAQARAAKAETDLDAAAARVRAAQDLVDNSRLALSLALSGVAASALFPWLLPVALTVAATAGLLLFAAAKRLDAATADMSAAATALGAARSDVAAAEAMVAKACSVDVTPTPPGPGTTLNSLVVLAGLRGGPCGRSAS